MASSERAEGADTTPATAPRTPARADADAGRRQGDQTSGAPAAEIEAGLRCDLLMNARYHASREAFLDTLHRILMFLIIVLGAAAITELSPWPWVRSVFAACATILAALDLTADLSNRARSHALMKRRYFELLADLAAHKRTDAEIVRTYASL